MYCYGRMWVPRFLGNGEVTSKSIYERARSARKPVRTGVRRAGVHQEVGSGPSLAEGAAERTGAQAGPGEGPRWSWGPRHVTQPVWASLLPTKWGADPTSRGDLRDDMRCVRESRTEPGGQRVVRKQGFPSWPLLRWVQGLLLAAPRSLK